MITRTPIKRKRPGKPRRGRIIDEDYKAFIAAQRCCICALYNHGDQAQLTPTEVAHVGVRGLGQKCSDRETIPLCAYDHREGSNSHHVLGKAFWAHHGLDRDKLIAKYQEAYAAESGSLSKVV